MIGPRAAGRAGGRCVAIAALASLGACATVPAPPAVTDPHAAMAAREARLAGIARWSADGRMALRAGEEGWSVAVRWRQLGERYRIRLSGPFGQGLVELDGEPDRVVLRAGEEPPVVAADAQSLLDQQVGWHVPVSGLRYWIMGRADPDSPVAERTLDAAGRPVLIVQSGWRIRYERYADHAGVALPVRLSLENARLSARLVVSRWELGG